MLADCKNDSADLPELRYFRYVSVILSVLLADFVPVIWQIHRYGKFAVLLLLLVIVLIFEEWCRYIFRKSGVAKSLAGSLARGELFPYFVFGGLYAIIYGMFNLGSILH